MVRLGWWWILCGAWPAWGENLPDPTRPPAAMRTAVGQNLVTAHCVSMTLVTDDRQLAVVDGYRVQTGEGVGTAWVREIAAQGVLLMEASDSRWHAVGECPPPEDRHE